MFGAGGVGLWVDVTNQRILLACVSCLPCAGMKAEEFSPSAGHRGLISGSDIYYQIFQNNRENGSLLVYFCLIPILGPVKGRGEK